MLAASCERVAPPAAGAKKVPTVRATVIYVKTAIQPANKALTHNIAISGNLARSSDELDQWRLFDLKNETVTFVDDIARTRRTEPIAKLLAERKRTLSAPVKDETPRVEFENTGTTRSLLGVQASQSVITVGNYRRELWIGAHPQIPPRLFALIQISDPPSSPLAPMMKSADEALTNVRGYPLVDRSEVPIGDKRMIVERAVTGVNQRDVPQSLFQIPASYRDLTVRTTERAARRLPVSLTLPGRKAPEAESQSSGTNRKNP